MKGRKLEGEGDGGNMSSLLFSFLFTLVVIQSLACLFLKSFILFGVFVRGAIFIWKSSQHRGNAKLKEHEVRDIRKRLKWYRAGDPEGCSPRYLAEVYSMTTEAIRKIERRELWGHLPDEEVKPSAQEQVEREASAQRMVE